METTESLASAVIHAITVDARERALTGGSRDWTQAFWDALAQLAQTTHLDLYPKEGPYKGEYHLDFVLWEPGYGPRVGIESQWLHWRQNDSRKSLGWAFDKLQGVKCDLKILIFDWAGLNPKQLPAEVVDRLHESMFDFQINSASEHYLFIWFEGAKSEVFEWKPAHDGKQSKGEIVFSPVKRE